VKRAGALLWAAWILWAGAAAAAPPLPPAVAEAYPSLKALGEGRLRWLGLHVYDAAVWTPNALWSPAEVFALDIRYAMNIKGRNLSVTSVKEMKKLGYTDPAKLKRWEEAMDRVFPDINPGDFLVGVSVPGKEARFYGKGGLLGAVADPEFAQAFFGIWLHEKTSEPRLRAQMLKLPE
jgi:hypothetical protein